MIITYLYISIHITTAYFTYIYCPSRPVLRATSLRSLASSFVDLPCIWTTLTTIPKNACRMALISVIMIPRSIACMPYRMTRLHEHLVHTEFRDWPKHIKTRCAPLQTAKARINDIIKILT